MADQPSKPAIDITLTDAFLKKSHSEYILDRNDVLGTSGRVNIETSFSVEHEDNDGMCSNISATLLITATAYAEIDEAETEAFTSSCEVVGVFSCQQSTAIKELKSMSQDIDRVLANQIYPLARQELTDILHRMGLPGIKIPWSFNIIKIMS